MPKKESIKERKAIVFDDASKMYNEYLETYFDQYMALSDNKKSKLGNRYDPVNLFLVNTYHYETCYKKRRIY